MAKLTINQARLLKKKLSHYIQAPTIQTCRDTESLVESMHQGFPAADTEAESKQIYRELVTGLLMVIEEENK